MKRLRDTLLVLLAAASLSASVSADDTRATPLASLLSELDAQSPSIAAARSRIAAAGAERDAAGRPEDPMLDLELDNLGLGQEDDRMMLRYAVRQPIPTIGMLGLQRDVADAMVSQREEAAERTALDVRLAAARAFAMLRMTQAEIGINERQQRLVELIAESALARMRSGTDAHHDVLQSQTELLSLRNQRTILEAQRIEAVAMINALRNRPPQTPFVAGDAFVFTPGAGEASTLEQSAVETRPELGEMKAMEREQRAMAALMKREARPMFSVGAWYNQMLMMPDSAGVMLSASLPFFGVPRQRARSRAAEQSAAAVASDRAAMAAMVRSEVRAVLARYQAAVERETLLRDVAIPRAEQALEQAQSSYRTGMMPYASVVQDRRMLAEMQMEHVRAEAERIVAFAELLRALGVRSLEEAKP
jgi:cobalt-zinc-cadmium efflux system outer membrane protein